MTGKIQSASIPTAEIFLSTSATTSAVGRAVRAGAARKIGPHLYTTNLTDVPEAIIRRSRWRIVALLVPGSVVSFRTAIEMAPTADGTVFLTGRGRHQIDLPGLRLRIVKGPGPMAGDAPFLEHLHIASRPRALLESLGPSRRGTTVARGLPRARIEELLEGELQAGGEARLNQIRDDAPRSPRRWTPQPNSTCWRRSSERCWAPATAG